MIYAIGTTLIIAACASAWLAALAFALVPGGHVALLRWGRLGAWLALLLAGGVAGLLLALFVLQRYDVRYVFDYSSSELEFRYRVAAVWAGQPGSLVVWALGGLIFAPLLMRRTRQLEPYILAPLLALQAVLLLFVLMRNPFVPTPTAELPATLLRDGRVIDGRGLNPQLHNVWMVIHPPTLFTAYGLLGVPFAMALGGLWRRDYDGWARLALPWTVAGWTVLSVALTLGGYWAYESLGWGGYWAWDPVENSSLVPWLTGLALIHGLVLQRAHGGLRRANFFLAILTYIAVFYASFLTRSGVLSSFSVHSFVEEGLKQVMITALIGLLLIGSGSLVWRWRDVPRRALSDALLSRDTFFVLLMLTLVLVGAVVAFGTSMPWITAIDGLGVRLERFFSQAFQIDDGTLLGGQPLGDGRFSLMPDFFTTTTTPLALVLAILMTIGPLLGWRGTHHGKLLRALRWPCAAAVLLTSVAMLLGVRDLKSILFVLVASTAAGTNLLMIVRTLRAGWLRIGGYLAHVGMALLLLGVVGSYGYASEEHKLVIPQGETQRVFGHSFTFWGYEERPDGKHVLRLEVDKDTAHAFLATPDVYFNQRMGAQVRTPAIKRYLWQDLYIAPEDYLPAIDPNVALLAPGQQITIGPYLLRFEEFAIEDRLQSDNYALIGATVTVTHEQQTWRLTPRLRLEPNQPITELPVALGNNHRLVLENFNAGERLVRLRIDGLHLPVVPARAVFTVSLKPAIALVWIGAVLMAVGGLIAVVRRRWEALPARQPAPRAGLIGWRRPAPSYRFDR
ncbi:cytochrome c biogenesis protein CcsA [Kallotenue papyrolyticum]|uniref:cytochrome c biogenesis protein CcsA n=1 Tax=Kallotenue papyrolyticum TaxID=1325125 RepID=UPI0004B57882|nr:cytochrome c-type biogenesis CcmF C-terminal domain-containing protein [Kallotenue papyrolyticum]